MWRRDSLLTECLLWWNSRGHRSSWPLPTSDGAPEAPGAACSASHPAQAGRQQQGLVVLLLPDLARQRSRARAGGGGVLGVLRPRLAPHPRHAAHPLPGGGQGDVPLRGARPGPSPRYYYYVQTAVTRATIPNVERDVDCSLCFLCWEWEAPSSGNVATCR